MILSLRSWNTLFQYVIYLYFQHVETFNKYFVPVLCEYNHHDIEEQK